MNVDSDDYFEEIRRILVDKYHLDYEPTERDRTLFNSGKVDVMYYVFQSGEVAFLIMKLSHQRATFGDPRRCN